MKNALFTLILVVLFFVQGICKTSRDSIMMNLGYVTQIESKYLHETKTVYVHLPFKFNPDEEYPLIVLSDFMAFRPLSTVTEIMGYNKTIPFCIVVCPVTTKVRQEYSPVVDNHSEKTNGGKTIDFWEKELLPFFESKYHISKKVLWGQNYSGMFSTFVMLMRPSLFDGYLSDLPQLDLLKEQLDTTTILNGEGFGKIFYQFSWTKTHERPASFESWIQKLQQEAPSNFNWNYTEEADSVFITHILTNYTYGLDQFFKRTESRQ